MSQILAIDDERPILDLLEIILTREGHCVVRASDGQEGLERMGQDIDLVITDLIMPNKEGLEAIAEMREAGFEQPVIAMTAGGLVGPAEYLHTASFIGADAVLAKPFVRDELATTVRKLLDHPRSASDSGETIST